MTFGKLPPAACAPWPIPAIPQRDDAVRVLGLYRLLSVAETEAASRGPDPEQGREIFGFYDDVIGRWPRGLTWGRPFWPDAGLRLGGPQAQAVRKLL